jgi:hypothetical protein
MKTMQSVTVVSAFTALAAITGMFDGSPRVRADDNNDETRIRRGFEIAPVPLNLAGKSRALVGLGSYLVNTSGDCNGCHTAGQPPDFNYAIGGDPYRFIPGTNIPQPKKVDPTTYLGGGQPFGTVDLADPGPDDPLIVSRNLTPDKTRRAEGGHTLEQFIRIIRTGVDLDHAHPNLPSGFDGNLLQIMPWPAFQDLTDHELEAIYEYLSAIPCLEGGPGEPPNRCK